MSVSAAGSMDCNGHVAVVVVNNTAGDFHGQSATASSWIESVNLSAGASITLNANVGVAVTSMSGVVNGTSVEGHVSSPWAAARPAECGAVPTTVPKPVDTTPQPVPTSAPGDIQMCNQPGSNPPFSVPCDSPLATTPYAVPTIPTSAVVDQPVDGAESTVAATTDTDSPKTLAVVNVRPKAVQPARLPSTGPGDIGLGPIGGLALLAGVVLVAITRCRSRTTASGHAS